MPLGVTPLWTYRMADCPQPVNLPLHAQRTGDHDLRRVETVRQRCDRHLPLMVNLPKTATRCRAVSPTKQA